MGDLTDLVPVSREEFASELIPCLALASGTGMAREDRREWLNAAYRALEGIPIALLRRGAAYALKVADHPSKIVPAITKEIQADWEWRRKMKTPFLQPEPAPKQIAVDYVTPAEAASILKKYRLA